MDGSGIRTNFDRTYTSTRTAISYPYIYLPRYGEELALMVHCIAPGELPLVLTHAGTLKQVGSCSLSALELSKLLRVYKFQVVMSETERRGVNSIQDLMEVIAWMLSSSHV